MTSEFVMQENYMYVIKSECRHSSKYYQILLRKCSAVFTCDAFEILNKWFLQRPFFEKDVNSRFENYMHICREKYVDT